MRNPAASFIRRITAIFLPIFSWTVSAQNISEVTVQIQVLDESGKPVPYVTVWQSEDPCERRYANSKITSGEDCFVGADLKRTATRLIETFEYAASYTSPMPFKRIGMAVSGDGAGVFRDRVHAPQLLWKVNGEPLNKFKIWSVFLKQGYEPALVDANYSMNEKNYQGTVVMKADPKFPRQNTANREAFERIRFELSDRRRNTVMSFANAKRLIDLKEELERLARSSEAAGENGLAARIHWRLKYMPSITTRESNGVTQIIGYDSGGRDDGERIWKTIIRLDPESPFHAYWASSKSLPDDLWPRVRDPSKPLSDVDRRTIEEYVDKREAELTANMSRLWPDRVVSFSGWLERLEQFERNYRWIRQFENLEPKFDAFESYYKFLQRAMKRAKVPVPKEWNLKPLPEDS